LIASCLHLLASTQCLDGDKRQIEPQLTRVALEIKDRAAVFVSRIGAISVYMTKNVEDPGQAQGRLSEPFSFQIIVLVSHCSGRTTSMCPFEYT